MVRLTLCWIAPASLMKTASCFFSLQSIPLYTCIWTSLRMNRSSIKTGRRLPCAYYGDQVATRFRRWVWSGLGGRSTTGDHVAGYLWSLFPRPLAEMGRQVDDGSTSSVLPSRPFFVYCKLIGYLTRPLEILASSSAWSLENQVSC